MGGGFELGHHVIVDLSGAQHIEHIVLVLGSQILDKQFKEGPEKGFLKFFLTHVSENGEKCYDGMVTEKVVERFTSVLGRALTQYLRGKFQEWLNNAIEKPEGNQTPETPPVEPPVEPVSDNGIITTEDELQAYFILKSICGELVPIKDIIIKDYKQFCNFYYKGCLNSKLLLRLYFNEKPYFIGLYDTEQEEKIAVDSPQDLFTYKERLLNRLKQILENQK